MRKLVLFIILSAFYTVLYSQKTSSINGRITDKQTGEPLPGATVTIKGSLTSVTTSSEGYYSLTNINAGQVNLIISYVGYENKEITVPVNEGATVNADAALNLVVHAGNEVVVAASKRAEKITNAPASIHVIGKTELERFSGSNIYELFSKVQGIEFVRTGVDYVAIN